MTLTSRDNCATLTVSRLFFLEITHDKTTTMGI